MENNYEKRIRVIFDQILLDVTSDIEMYDDVDFRIDYIDNLKIKAYGLVKEQSKYTNKDVDTNFDNTYNEIKDILSNKIKG